MGLTYDVVKHKNKNYAVIKTKYKNMDVPVLIDLKDVSTIKNINKDWKSNKYGFISCVHTMNNDDTKDVYLHEIIMALKMKDASGKRQIKPIVHLNRIGLDNRRENLMYDVQHKDLNKNIKKKQRTITLPDNSGVKPSEIPTYVWYMKPNGSHGDRFMVDINDVQWKTTSSKSLSLRYKLEEAKAYLRELRKTRPDLFQDYSMNGDFTQVGRGLIDSYYTIVHKAGYEHMERYIPKNITNKMLKPGSVSRLEKELLKDLLTNQSSLLNKTGGKRRVVTNLPQKCGVSSSEVPDHCYYRPACDQRGGFFIVKGHPNQDKIWQGSSSKKLSIRDKFDSMLDYLDELDDDSSDSDY
jgi:hypothetical protein